MKKLNMNDKVKVKLTPLGTEVFYHNSKKQINKLFLVVENHWNRLCHELVRKDLQNFSYGIL